MFSFRYGELYCAHKSDEHPRMTDDPEYSSHCHNGVYEIYIFLSGDVTYTVEDRKKRLERGDALIIKPGEYHSLAFGGDEPYERIVLQIPEKLILYNLRDVEIIGFYTAPETSYIDTVTSLLDSMYVNFSRSTETLYYNLIALSYILYSHLVLVCGKAENVQTIEDDIVRDMLEYVNENLSSPISVEDIYARFPYSKTCVYKRFKRFAGISPKKYLDIKRMYFARTRIMTGVPPTEVADAMGFENYNSFYRLYLSITGNSPSADKEDAARDSAQDSGFPGNLVDAPETDPCEPLD